MHLNKDIFPSQQLQKYMTYETHFFAEHCKLFAYSKNVKKMQQKIDGFPNNLI